LLLWHWPFLAFARNWYGADLTFVQVNGRQWFGTFRLGPSWRYVEQPLLDHTVNSLPFLKLGTAAMITGCGLAAVIFVGQVCQAAFRLAHCSFLPPQMISIPSGISAIVMTATRFPIRKTALSGSGAGHGGLGR